MLDPLKHNYMKKLMELYRQGKVPQAGQPMMTDVCHDDWCAIYRGRYCNCDPEIRFYPVEDLGRRN
jgi:hypothetical protein